MFCRLMGTVPAFCRFGAYLGLLACFLVYSVDGVCYGRFF